MARERSPNYPQISLADAIKRVQDLFKRESRSPVAPEIAVLAWKYSGLNGAARRQLGALRQYGLIQYEKSGEVRVSSRGVTVAMRSPTSGEYIQAIKDAALSPGIFRELYDTKQGASDDALQHYLVAERKFSPDGAKQVIESYRETLEIAKLGEPSYNEQTEEEFEMPEKSQQDGRTSSRDFTPAEPLRPHEEFYRIKLSNGVTAEVRFWGNEVTPLELQLLREYLEFQEKALTYAARGGVKASTSSDTVTSKDEA